MLDSFQFWPRGKSGTRTSVARGRNALLRGSGVACPKGSKRRLQPLPLTACHAAKLGIGRGGQGFSIFDIFAPTQENSRTRTSTIKELKLPPIVLVLLLDLLLRAHTRIAQKRVPRAAPNARQALASHLSLLTSYLSLSLSLSPSRAHLTEALEASSSISVTRLWAVFWMAETSAWERG